ncbi:MAG: CRISPR-associated endonuclease Cas2 [Pseudomonadota bacterium]
MFVMICYDIADDRRRDRLAQVLLGFGERVQYSVFECHLDSEGDLARLHAAARACIDETCDRLRFYQLCPADLAKLAIDGRGQISRDWAWRLV